MNADFFERNLERLIGRAALRPDPAAARRRFLSALEPRKRSWRMTAMVASMIAALTLWFALPRQEPKPETPPVAPAPRPPEPPTPVVAAAPPPLPVRAPTLRDPRPTLKIEGPVDLPENTEIVLSLSLQKETLAGGRLVPLAVQVGSCLATVKGAKFKAEMDWAGPGEYIVSVGRFGGPARGLVQYTMAGFGDDALGRAAERLPEIGAAAKEALDLISRIGTACASKETWEPQKKKLADEAGALLKKLDRMDARWFPAAHAQIRYSLFNINGSLTFFDWKGDVFGVKSYHANGEPVKTFRGDAFSFETFRKYVEESVPAAGREMALWALKDLRRAGPRPAVAEALRLHAAHAGLADFAERLGKASKEDLDALEKEIRR